MKELSILFVEVPVESCAVLCSLCHVSQWLTVTFFIHKDTYTCTPRECYQRSLPPLSPHSTTAKYPDHTLSLYVNISWESMLTLCLDKQS